MTLSYLQDHSSTNRQCHSRRRNCSCYRNSKELDHTLTFHGHVNNECKAAHFPWMSTDAIVMVPNVEKNAKNFNRLSRVHERYTQTTDRRTGDSI